MIPQFIVPPNDHRVLLLLVTIVPLQPRSQQDVAALLHNFYVVRVALYELIREECEIAVAHQSVLHGMVAGDGVNLHKRLELF